MSHLVQLALASHVLEQEAHKIHNKIETPITKPVYDMQHEQPTPVKLPRRVLREKRSTQPRSLRK